MSDLERALGDISRIRRQVAETTLFRGYGPLTLAGTGLLALAAAATQMLWLPHPEKHVTGYLGIWIATAMLSAGLIGTEMYARTRRIHSGLADEMIHTAVEQFMPSVAVGGLVTITFLRFIPGSLWMLPGLWQVIYALGILASCRFLPRLVMVAAMWYLVTGLSALSLAGSRALAPAMMGLSYGIGQFLIAGILQLVQREGQDDL